MRPRRWLPLILLGIALMLAQFVAAIGSQVGANWMVWLPGAAIAIAMIPWALNIEKFGRTLALLAAAATMTIAVLGQASVGWFFIPSGVLAAVVGWLGIKDDARTPTSD